MFIWSVVSAARCSSSLNRTLGCAPGLKAAIHTINFFQPFFAQKLGCTLARVTVIANHNNGVVGVCLFNKFANIVITQQQRIVHMPVGIRLLIAYIYYHRTSLVY